MTTENLVVLFIYCLQENEDQWQTVFLMTSGIYFVGNTIFIGFGSAQVQPWNDPDWLKSSKLDVIAGK
jgi:ACS family sodium-dependent inorganic phosphate cotransporter-like MFS transporter 5